VVLESRIAITGFSKISGKHFFVSIVSAVSVIPAQAGIHVAVATSRDRAKPA
jgi:hypothetical protein